MNIEAVRALLAERPLLAMRRESFDAVVAALGSGWSPEQVQAAFSRSPRERNDVERAVAIIPIFGMLDYRPSWLTRLFGATSVLEISADLDAALADRDVRTIVLLVDSPGGFVDGVPELGWKILAARKRKRIVAVADTMAASAAYWLAAMANELVVTPSGSVGSIGVFSIHEDLSGVLQKLGIVVTPIAAGKRKLERAPFAPLADEAREYWQKQVDAIHGEFVDAIMLGRGVSPSKVRGPAFGQGRILRAQDAVDVGMADRVGTFENELVRIVEQENRMELAELAAAARWRQRRAADRSLISRALVRQAERRERVLTVRAGASR